MPFAPLPRPQPALGLLEAALREAEISVEGCYFNLWFAKRHGDRYHDWPYKYLKFFLGDWLFSAPVFGMDSERDRRYFDALARHMTQGNTPTADMAERIATACRQYRDQASAFIHLAAGYALATGARVIGCSSNFQQHLASIALLAEVRRRNPGVITLLGGANCEGPMGPATHRNFPWLDYVVSGEGDEVIVPLVKKTRDCPNGIPLEQLPDGVWGPAHRQQGYHRPPEHCATRCPDLNTLPTPDYHSYFAWVERLALKPNIRPGIPVEGSRGCWWGRCTFCGLNGDHLIQRSKRTERLLMQMDLLQARHGYRDFELTDNVPPPQVLHELSAHLRQGAQRRRLFCEVRAGLSRDQVAHLSQAGIRYVQAGIEGLHTEVLQCMRKGTQTWQNVQLLKWTREFGILCTYNLLWGLPGEQDHWYAQTAAWLPLIEHLAPGVVLKLRFDRFSDYHRRQAHYGLRLRPHPAMALVYPLAEAELLELSYFFEHEPERPSGLPPGVQQLCQVTNAWLEAFFRTSLQPILARSDNGEQLEILDTRSCAVARQHRLHGALRALYRLADRAPPLARLAALLQEDFGLTLSQGEIDPLRAELLDRRLAVELDDRLIALAIRGEQPALPGHRDFPGGRVVTHWKGMVP